MHDLHNSWTLPSVSKERKVIILPSQTERMNASGGYIFQSGDFCAATDRHTNRLLYPRLHMCGVMRQ